MENQIANAATKYWSARLPAMEIDGYYVLPLDSAEKIIRASFAMRNCLADCVEDSATGKAEYYALQKDRSGKIEYCIGITFDESSAPLNNVKGFANSSAPDEAKQVAEVLLDRRREAQ